MSAVATGWRWRAPAQDGRAASLRMFTDGAKPAEVAAALGVARATAYRWHGEWREGRP